MIPKRRDRVAFGVHVFSLSCYILAICHDVFIAEFKKREGGPCRYFTFNNMLIQACFHLLSIRFYMAFFKHRNMGACENERRARDKFFFVAFPFAMSVSVLYWLGHHALGAANIVQPDGLNHIRHTLMFFTVLLSAKIDHIRRANGLLPTIIITGTYVLYVVAIEICTGSFPYGFLNKMPYPTQYIAFLGLFGVQYGFEGLGQYLFSRH